MADDPKPPSPFLSSLPDQPITDDIVRQIGESDNPNMGGAMGFPGSTPVAIEAFLLHLQAKTLVIVFDPSAERWRVYESFESADLSHEEMVDRASGLVNEWLGESLSDRQFKVNHQSTTEYEHRRKRSGDGETERQGAQAPSRRD